MVVAGLPLVATHGEDASLTPVITVRNGTAFLHERLAEAVARFTDAGLLLPNLEVEFGDNRDDCGGHFGLFRHGPPPWKIQICSSLDFVYEHELAHAWERANLTDEVRGEFMRLRGYSTWADNTAPWNERGVEGVAVVIQQGLAGLPLPAFISSEHENRLEAYALLTGRPAPRLLEWCEGNTREPICQSG